MRDFVEKIRDKDYIEANSIIHRISGIVDFFCSEEQKNDFVFSHGTSPDVVCENQSTYGDWQTPHALALRVCKNHLERYGNPDVVIEPTCGLGAFVMAALDTFPHIKALYAIEINEEYVHQLKTAILAEAISSPKSCKPDIYIHNTDFFKFDLSSIRKLCGSGNLSVGIIGNPPWVTNSHQGKNSSSNLPTKSNRYHLSGIDAITGKSNFDISEYITLSLLNELHGCKGGISFLLKNSVIRNIILKQPANTFLIDEIRQEKIDAEKEFNVSVDASCLSANLGSQSAVQCLVADFYSKSYISTYGWVGNHFSSDLFTYEKYAQFDGESSYVWRSGIKHDCALILELSYENGVYTNGLNEVVEVEDEYIYPLLKSSDIQKDIADFRKFIIVPQQKTGQDTSCLKNLAPKLYAYLKNHEEHFSKRKSSIYKGKDRFSIFGIGDYSFKPFKIVVSSLYKTINFKIISDCDGKPVMVDDTCYQLDFDSYAEALTIYQALNSEELQSLLRALTFTDSKRVVTKSLLMRLKLAEFCKYKGLKIKSSGPSGRIHHQLSLFD